MTITMYQRCSSVHRQASTSRSRRAALMTLASTRCSVVIGCGGVNRPRPPQKTSTATPFGVGIPPKTVGLSGDVANGVVHVHKMRAQSLDTVTTTARAVVATIKRSVVDVDGGGLLMRLAGHLARVCTDHRERAVPPWFRRWICFRGQPPCPAERSISEGA